eukprot:scaffold478098_cov18-Prasinocladus_malaysianus.AAC.1
MHLGAYSIGIHLQPACAVQDSSIVVAVEELPEEGLDAPLRSAPADRCAYCLHLHADYKPDDERN